MQPLGASLAPPHCGAPPHVCGRLPRAGAGLLAGLHARAVGAGAPSEYSSELRDEIFDATWAAFDELRAAAELQGEQLHALHDFKQYGRRTTDVGGLNLKGLYTRERAPKDGARARLAERYRAVAAGACAPAA